MDQAAVFDLDNTLIRGSSLFRFAMMRVRHGQLSPLVAGRFAYTEYRYRTNGTELAGVSQSISTRALSLVEGWSQDELLTLAAKFTTKAMNRWLDSSVTSLVQHFNKLGIPTYIATASPLELASTIAGRLGMAGAIGTQAETCNGIYTGRLAAPISHGPAKADQVRSLLDERGHDPSRCWAFSDSANDLPLLASVGHPVGVNPDRVLSLVCAQNQWPVLHTRTHRGQPEASAMATAIPYLY